MELAHSCSDNGGPTVYMAKMYKICLQNSIKFKFSRGTAPDPAGGLTAPPDPQLDFVPMNKVGRTGYFLAAMALANIPFCFLTLNNYPATL